LKLSLNGVLEARFKDVIVGLLDLTSSLGFSAVVLDILLVCDEALCVMLSG